MSDEIANPRCKGLGQDYNDTFRQIKSMLAKSFGTLSDEDIAAQTRTSVRLVRKIKTTLTIPVIDGVYFIYSPTLKSIKIGYSKDIAYRIHSISQSIPIEIELIGHIPKVSVNMEKILHRYFDRHRSRGEWFDDSEDIRNFINQTPEQIQESLKKIFRELPPNRKKITMREWSDQELEWIKQEKANRARKKFGGHEEDEIVELWLECDKTKSLTKQDFCRGKGLTVGALNGALLKKGIFHRNVLEPKNRDEIGRFGPGRPKIKIDCDEVNRLRDSGVSIAAIARKNNVSRRTIQRHLNEDRRGKGRPSKNLDLQTVKCLLNLLMSNKVEVARRLGCHPETLRKFMVKQKIGEYSEQEAG